MFKAKTNSKGKISDHDDEDEDSEADKKDSDGVDNDLPPAHCCSTW